MSTKTLTTPIKDEDLEDIRIGDILYLDGYLITARDQAHHRLVKLGRKLPVDLKGKAIFHAGPIMVPTKDAKSGWKVVSIGPTTSMRMEIFEKEFLAETSSARSIRTATTSSKRTRRSSTNARARSSNASARSSTTRSNRFPQSGFSPLSRQFFFESAGFFLTGDRLASASSASLEPLPRNLAHHVDQRARRF